MVLLGWLGCGILKKAEDNLQAVMQEMNSFSTWKILFFFGVFIDIADSIHFSAEILGVLDIAEYPDN